MVATLQKGYVVIVLAVVLLAGMFGWTMKTELAASLNHPSAIHATQQSVALSRNVECPPPPYSCH